MSTDRPDLAGRSSDAPLSRIEVDAYASHTWYLDHIGPVWKALPPGLRGVFIVERTMLDYARSKGIEAQAMTSTLRRRPGAIIVAAYGDLRYFHRRPIIFMEHGAGQAYQRTHPSYAGGPGRERVGLFLAPSERVVELNRRAWPHASHAAVGCPKLDAWHRMPAKVQGEPPVVAISWHWNCTLFPETNGAFAHYKAALPDLARAPFKVLGHGHPRLFTDQAARLAESYKEAGIEIVRSFEEVVQRADLLACDNSSAMYEFASLGRPVVVMNAPWFRRHVEHGMRFWEYADVGVQVEGPRDLVRGITTALGDPERVRERREEIVSKVYSVADGSAGQRAATAIAGWLGVRAGDRAA